MASHLSLKGTAKNCRNYTRGPQKGKNVGKTVASGGSYSPHYPGIRFHLWEQDISIARAFLKDAPIILLDEASASLDVENETVIQEALSRLIRDKTVIVIAHRMRTVSGADRIVVLSDGTVAEEGTPKELLAREDSAFRHMAQLQTASAEWSIYTNLHLNIDNKGRM